MALLGIFIAVFVTTILFGAFACLRRGTRILLVAGILIFGLTLDAVAALSIIASGLVLRLVVERSARGQGSRSLATSGLRQ